MYFIIFLPICKGYDALILFFVYNNFLQAYKNQNCSLYTITQQNFMYQFKQY